MPLPVYRQKPFFMFGSACLLTFATLFFFRLDLHNRWFNTPTRLDAAAVEVLSDQDNWMSIYQDDTKIGYARRLLNQTQDGYRFKETIFMRLRTMGLVQNLHVNTTGRLQADFTLADFRFEMSSSRFRYTIEGRFDGRRMHVTTKGAGPSQEHSVALDNPPYLIGAVANAVYATGLTGGKRYAFDIFDPTTLGQAEVLVSVIGRETIDHMGRPIDTTKIMINFQGANQLAWLNGDGKVVREKGLLGLRMERTDRSGALSGIAGRPGTDLIEAAAVASDVDIPQVQRLNRLVVAIRGIRNDAIALDGGRQTFAPPVLTIQKESLDDLPGHVDTEGLGTLEGIFLNPSPFIQSDHPQMRQLAAQIVVDPRAAPLDKAKRIVDWVYRNIEKRPVLSVPDALTTLESKVGDCNEHAILLAALARAAGLPARVEIGLAYLNGRFYYHAWNLLYVGRWVTADGVFGQLPADVTHIRLATGPQKQLDLMGVIGQIQIEVMETND